MADEADVGAVTAELLATLVRDYETKRAEYDRLKEEVKPASDAASLARAKLHDALKRVRAPFLLDGRLYRLAGNGKLVEEDVLVAP